MIIAMNPSERVRKNITRKEHLQVPAMGRQGKTRKEISEG